MIKEIHSCRACSGPLEQRLALPVSIYPSLFTDLPEIPKEWPVVPLCLYECIACHLVQLKHTFSPDDMYRNYWYKSALNSTMVEALRDVVSCSSKIVDLRSGDMVVDIGCNDGTLLRCYADTGLSLYRVGVDPSRNLADSARANCDLFLNEYFTENKLDRKARLITAIAMFYDLEDISGFLRSVLTWLEQDGVFVIQMTDLLSMMSQNAFDNIVHEHLEYWSLRSLLAALKPHGLTVFCVTENQVNGGSLRAFCCRSGTRGIDHSVGAYLSRESTWIESGWRSFEVNLHRTISSLKGFLIAAQSSNKKVCGIGASTKGNTLLQLLGADIHISSIGEVSGDKFGKYTIGTKIPILPEKEVLESGPDYLLVLPWHFYSGFRKKLSNHNVLLPMPVPKLNGVEIW